MAEILKGAPVAAAMDEKTKQKAEELKARGIFPKLALIRIGEKAEDCSYEKQILKRCGKNEIEVVQKTFPVGTGQEELIEEIQGLNRDSSVHGVLLFLPFPKESGLDEKKIRETLAPEKDVDGVTAHSLAGVFTGSGTGFTPCTAQAAMEILSYYNITVCGKNAVVLGRSLVVGRPLAMLLLGQNATVTVCHTKTEHLREITKKADILAATVGKAELFDRSYLGENQILIDVGINWNEKTQKICGDFNADAAQEMAGAFTPVPGGVGGVTTAVLAKHVAEAAERQCQP